MKLTSRGEYATRALFYLAQQPPTTFVSVARIAAENELPRKYLEQILTELRGAGVLTSREGARGGYRLAVSPSQVTIGSVLRLLDGPMAPIGCVAGDPALCGRFEATCGTKPFWSVMTRMLDWLVDSVTFADLLDSYEGRKPLFPGPELVVPLGPAYLMRDPVAPARADSPEEIGS
ncbi:MAG: Rrf2 family transcriptional regulator [bacterium]